MANQNWRSLPFVKHRRSSPRLAFTATGITLPFGGRVRAAQCLRRPPGKSSNVSRLAPSAAEGSDRATRGICGAVRVGHGPHAPAGCPGPRVQKTSNGLSHGGPHCRGKLRCRRGGRMLDGRSWDYFALAMNYSAVANHAVNLTVHIPATFPSRLSISIRTRIAIRPAHLPIVR